MSFFKQLMADPFYPPAKPASYNVARWSGTAHARTAVNLRQTALEMGVLGVDVAKSWSFWIDPSNILIESERVFGVGPSANSNLQYSLAINPASASTNNQCVSFVAWSTFASVFIRITSSAKILKNRWTHVIVTYTGSELSSGFNLYINGVLDSSAIKDSAGSYSGGANDSTFRFFVSAVNNSALRFAGNLRDLAIWNIALNQTQVDELFNLGVPYTLTSASFYATNIVAYWPLQANLACTNNVLFNLINDSNIDFITSPISTSYAPMTIFNGYPPNTAYVAFGPILKIGAQYRTYQRSGTSHLLGGNITHYVFNAATLALAAPTTVIDEVVGLMSCCAKDFDAATINVFTTFFNGVSFSGLVRYESSDGLTGLAFNAAVTMTPTTLSSYNWYGKVVEGYVPGEYWVCEPEQTGATNYGIYIWKRNAAGTWSRNTVWTGSPGNGYQEPALLRAGNNTFILIMRSDLLGGLHYCVSTDGGATWSTPTATGVGSGVCNADLCLDPYGRIVMVWMDRATNRINITTGNKVSTIIANPTSWNASSIFFQSYSTDSLGILGYPSIIRDGWNYILALSAEFSSSRADLFIGYGRLD